MKSEIVWLLYKGLLLGNANLTDYIKQTNTE
jgi:hypothetical protein